MTAKRMPYKRRRAEANSFGHRPVVYGYADQPDCAMLRQDGIPVGRHADAIRHGGMPIWLTDVDDIRMIRAECRLPILSM